VSVRAAHRGTGEGSVAGGQLAFAGMSRNNGAEDTLAITGGTGLYKAARGEIRLRGDKNDEHATVTLVG
jgi:hypothetical protein